LVQTSPLDELTLALPSGSRRRGAPRAGPALRLAAIAQAPDRRRAHLARRPSARETAEAFAIVAAVHVPINVIGHVLGVRSSSL
jgi:hypothetical protein